MMNISKKSVADLCVGWAIAILLGLSFGLNAPFVLMLIWTVLLLTGG
jgi:hypothetical protein